ncbi:MAG: transketolase, partial [Nanoarchaeota archaeon]
NNMSHGRGLQIRNPAERFRAFSCEVVEVNGHDVDVLGSEIAKKGNKVRVVVANTVKGYGCKTFVQDQYAWHRRSPNDSELEMLLKELDEETI